MASPRRLRKKARISYAEPDLSDDHDSGQESNTSESSLIHTKKRKGTKSAPAPKPPQKKDIFPFLELPAELRNQIYEYCLLIKNDVIGLKHNKKKRQRVVSRCTTDHYIVRGWIGGKGIFKRPRLVPKILLINRQMYNEGIKILYGDNTFAFTDSSALHIFLIRLSLPVRQMIKTITLSYWLRGTHNFCAMAALIDCVGLKSFLITADICGGLWSFRSQRRSKEMAERFYLEAELWMKAIVEKRSFNVLLEVLHLDRAVPPRSAPAGAVRPFCLPDDQAKIQMVEELKKLLNMRD